MREQQGHEYYIQHTSEILKEHEKIMSAARPVLIENYGEAQAERLIEWAREEYEELIPRFPYIGGKANPMTGTLTQCASLLALYRALQRHGTTVEETGELVYRIAQGWVAQYPALLRHLLGRFAMTRFWRERKTQRAERSQKRAF
jgi:hypothetical protein